MRNVLFVFLIIAIPLTGICQNKKEKKAIKQWGIKSVTEMLTEYVNGKDVTRKDSYISFDKNGNVLLKEEFKKDGSIKHKELNKFDAKGNIIEEIVFETADKKSVKNYKKTYKYDVSDNKIEENEFDDKGLLLKKVTFSYNTSGDKLTETEFNAVGKQIKKAVFTYDSKGFKASKKEYDENNQLTSTRNFQYEN
jgi:hypothetical protein